MTMRGQAPVSVIIPVYRNEESVAHTLARIWSCDPLPTEVLLHFDGGWSPKADLSEGAPVPVRVFRSTTNVGPGGGRHLLIKEAREELVASFDDDSWPYDADYFAQAVMVMGAFPDAAVLSPAVSLREKPVQPRLLEVSESVAFEGSASVTRRSHYLRLPGYVPVPQAYGVEEVDLALQVHAEGLQVLSCPWMRAWHNRPYTDNQHSINPWIRNEVLLAFLRYPRWLQPWGWLRAVRHVLNHWQMAAAGGLLGALASSPEHCTRHLSHVRRYSLGELRRHHFGKRRRWLLQMREEGKVSAEEAPPLRRALFVQYTNPAGYPPLQHSSQILARCGWDVRFAGVEGRRENPLRFPPHERISTMALNVCPPGPWQKLHYLGFVIWAAWQALRFRPEWVYASDPFAATPTRLIRWLTGCRVVYHEHDSPTETGTGVSFWLWLQGGDRARIIRSADLVVLPNEARLRSVTARYPAAGQTFCVWNCPAADELGGDNKQKHGPLMVLYHGSIVPDRFPMSNLQALALSGRDIRIRLVGYETRGSAGYTKALAEEAERLGVGDKFEYLGPQPLRADLMARCAEADVGLCLLRIHGEDINMQHMAGASNKPFDYLSQGLALVVPEDSEWKALYVDAGCAKPCKVADAASLAKLLVWMDDHREEVREMGIRGRELIRSKWNYEAQFAPVLHLMNCPTPP